MRFTPVVLLVACTTPVERGPDGSLVSGDVRSFRDDLFERSLIVDWVDRPLVPELDGAWQARSGLGRTYLLPDRLVLIDRRDNTPDWTLDLSWLGYGRGTVEPVGAGRARADGRRFESRRPRGLEWFDNGPEGLHHGFELEQRPAGAGPVAVELAVAGLEPQALPDGARFLDADGTPRAEWRGLAAWDAAGRDLPVSPVSVRCADDCVLRFEVDDRDATWPLSIDPLLTVLEADQSLAAVGPSPAWTGFSLDLDGDTLILGNPGLPADNATDGLAVILERNLDDADEWGIAAELDPGTGDIQLGQAVALDQPRAVITSLQGTAVHVYFNDGAGWGLEATLSRDTVGGFGAAVALEGDTVVVGAPYDDVGGTNAGSVHVFNRHVLPLWGQMPGTPLRATAPLPDQQLGAAVAISGDRFVAGEPNAPGVGRVHVYRFNASGVAVGEVAVLSDPGGGVGRRFGAAVALDGDRLVVGAPGGSRAFVYERLSTGTSSESWSAPIEVARVGAVGFGSSVALSGDLLAVTDLPTSGTARVHLFERRGSGFAPVATLDAGPTTGAAALPVRVGPGLVAVGVPETASFRVWRRSGGRWITQEETWWQSGVGALLGVSVDASGPLVAVGATGADFMGADAGAVAIYERTEPGDWTYRQELYGDADSLFGTSVALHEDVLLVGAPGDSPAGTAAGAAELFVYDGVFFDSVRVFDPSVDATLGASDLPDLEYGASVALDSTVAVIGAPGRSADNGVAYVYGRNSSTAPDVWTSLGQFGIGAAGGDQMGRSVAVGGGMLAVGSSLADGVAGIGSGRVILAELQSQVPTEVQTLEGAAAGDDFGKSIRLVDDWLVVGAPGADADAGEVVLYRRGTDGGALYDEVVRLARAGGAADRFGLSVAMTGDRLYVGAPKAGVVEERTRNQLGADAWGTTATLTGSAVDQFGYAVAATGDTLAVGEPAATVLGDGAVHLHTRDAALPPVVTGEAWTVIEDGGPLEVDSPGFLENDFDPNGDPLTVTLVRSPFPGSVFSFDPTGGFTYRPPPDFVGVDGFDYAVSDGTTSVTATVTITVTPVNDPPVAVDDGPFVTDEEVPLSVVAPGVLANDTDVDDTVATLEAVLEAAPAHGALVLDPSGSFVYTPAINYVGDDVFTYRARDPSGATSAVAAEVRLVVGPANDAPTVPVERRITSVVEDTPYLVGPPGLLDPAGVSDLDGDALTAVILDPPTHGAAIVHPNGAWVYTPEPEWSGEDRFTWRAFDGLEYSTPSTVILTVAPVNDPPIGVPDGPYDTDEDVPFTIDPDRLVQTDLDVEDDPRALQATLEPTMPPEHGVVVVDPVSGSFVYTPDPDWNGLDAFWYRARDLGGAASEPTPVAVRVLPVNDAPRTTADDLGQVAAGGTESGDLLANDSDPEGDEMVAELVSPPIGGDVVLRPDGTFDYTARTSFVGQDRFLYLARDPAGAASPPTVVEVVVLPDDGTTGPTEPEDTGCLEQRWYLDADGDGFGADDTEVSACAAPLAHVDRGGDCDDTRASSHPGAPELPGDGFDQDCDGLDNLAVPRGACSVGPAPGGVGALLVGIGLLALRRRRPVLGLAAALAVAPTARAGALCGEDTPAVVDEAVEALWGAYSQVDEAAFDRASKNLDAAISCLDRAPTAAQVARLHQAMALVSFVNGQTRASRRSLAAARLLDPGWKLDEGTFPPGHPYRDLWASATDPGPVEGIGRISPDAWWVDGIEREEAPTERAFLLQVSSGDRIDWSGYLWSFDEVPDRGQATERSPLETPHDWVLVGALQGRVLSSRQDAEVPVVWADQKGTSVGGGAAVLARFTPITVVGGELGASLVGPVDPVLGGDGAPSGHAVLLLGGGGWIGTVQPHASARLGASVDRVRAWTTGANGEVANLWTIPSLLAGVEIGARTAAWRSTVAVDGLFGAARVPWELRVRGDGGWRVGEGPLAIEGGLLLRNAGMPYEDVDGSRIGARREFETRLSAGLGVWL